MVRRPAFREASCVGTSGQHARESIHRRRDGYVQRYEFIDEYDSLAATAQATIVAPAEPQS